MESHEEVRPGAAGPEPAWFLTRPVTRWARGGRRYEETEYRTADDTWTHDQRLAMRRREPPTLSDQLLAARLASDPASAWVGKPAWIRLTPDE